MGDRPVRTYRELFGESSAMVKLRTHARDAAVWVLSLRARPPRGIPWIRFPYYHHVFDDELKGFACQLRYMRNLGEFVTMDQAVDLLSSDEPIDGRYFCITFDDGFRNCLANAIPILVEHGAPAAFFLPTDYIGTSIETDREKIRRFYGHGRSLIEFLDWDEVREMARAGMTIGSHTVRHELLSSLSAEEVDRELRESKRVIEDELGAPCDHFCAPRGRPGLDFLPERDPELARQAGYRSFLSTRRGSAFRRPNRMNLDRDHTVAHWGVYQLRYFLSR